MVEIYANLSNPEPLPPNIEWAPAWGWQIKQGDYLRVVKLGGVVVVDSVSKFYNTRTGPALQPDEGSAWYFGLIVHDLNGQDYHLMVQPTEAVFIGSHTPDSSEDVVKDGTD